MMKQKKLIFPVRAFIFVHFFSLSLCHFVTSSGFLVSSVHIPLSSTLTTHLWLFTPALPRSLSELFLYQPRSFLSSFALFWQSHLHPHPPQLLPSQVPLHVHPPAFCPQHSFMQRPVHPSFGRVKTIVDGCHLCVCSAFQVIRHIFYFVNWLIS